MTNAKIDPISEDLFLITLVPPITGFNNFIGVWLKTGKPTFIIDVGPTATASHLRDALKELSIDKLDFILLTHIHIDHAGGIGNVLEYFPETPIICHKSAIPHLSDPARLWEGSLKTLGNMAHAYGPIKPVPENLLVDAEHFIDNAITPIITPGHAPHHVSFVTPQCLFAGETCGVHLRLPSGQEYQRPATPPRFFLETRLMAHRDQLIFWKNIIKDEMKNAQKESFFSDCIERLMREDPNMACFDLLNDGEKEREMYFITNSIKGYVGYLNHIADNS